MGLEVQDKINIQVAEGNELVTKAVQSFGEYIQSETQALSLKLSAEAEKGTVLDMDDFEIAVLVEKA
jgi:isoleucyl-tRNA synthetase